jgi:hypothetical protein
MNKTRGLDLLWSCLAGFILGLILTSLDGQGGFWQGWFAYSLLSGLGILALVLTWRWSGSERWMGLVLLLAFGLRLGIGVGLSFILPASGYDTEVQRAGYNSVDAYNRDMQSWELAGSDRSLLDAFDKDYAIDQYGGLEALSAFIYRYLSPDAHRPWLVILVAALTASLGIAFLWKAARTVWNEQLARVAACLFAFYPESLWLGGSQMREPFLLTFSTLVFWGVVAWLVLHERKGWIWLLGGSVGLLLFSPGVFLFCIFSLAGWTWLRSGQRRIPWRGLALASGVLGIGLVVFWAALSHGTFEGAPLFETLAGWFKYSIRWDIYQLERDSGMIQYLFRHVLPPDLKIPFIFVYGLLQPVLPAALFDPSPWIWQTVAIVRSLGWYLILPWLVFSFIAIVRTSSRDQKAAWLWMFFITWLWMAFSALRAGGDQWDNPRYRAIFLIFQAFLAAKAFWFYRETHNAWLARIILVELVYTLLFSYWYASRFFPSIPSLPLEGMMVLMAVIVLVILLGGWLMERHKRSLVGK